MTEAKRKSTNAAAARASLSLLQGGVFEAFGAKDIRHQLETREQLLSTSEWGVRWGFFQIGLLDPQEVKDSIGWRGEVPKNATKLSEALKSTGATKLSAEYIRQSIGMVKFMHSFGIPLADLDSYGYEKIRSIKTLCNKLAKYAHDGVNWAKVEELFFRAGIDVDKKDLDRAVSSAEIELAKFEEPKEAKRVVKSATETPEEKTTGLSPEQFDRAVESIGVDALMLAMCKLSDDALAELLEAGKVEVTRRKNDKAVSKHMNKPKAPKTGRLVTK